MCILISTRVTSSKHFHSRKRLTWYPKILSIHTSQVLCAGIRQFCDWHGNFWQWRHGVCELALTALELPNCWPKVNSALDSDPEGKWCLRQGTELRMYPVCGKAASSELQAISYHPSSRQLVFGSRKAQVFTLRVIVMMQGATKTCTR